MYCIMSQSDNIIALDHALLALLNARDIEDLYRKTALDEIKLERLGREELRLNIGDENIYYATEESTLSGILGELTIVHLLRQIDKTTDKIAHEKVELSDYNPKEPYEISHEKESADTEIFKQVGSAQESMYELKKDETFTDDLLTKEAVDTAEDLPSLQGSTRTNKQIHPSETQHIAKPDEKPVVIDIVKISRQIGISPEEYSQFLNEYIDVAIDLEEALSSTDSTQRTAAIETLKHLSDVLHLEQITNIVDQIATAKYEDQKAHISSLYSLLSRITIDKNSGVTPQSEIDTTKTPITAPPQNDLLTKEGFGTIHLEEIEPIHFQFSLNDAAEDLGLPLDLIEEFVHDFIRQSKEETSKMLQAYEKGDLKSIQDTAHLLKGAAANLRITPLADILYQIQLCEESSRLDALIKDYWAHFISFEKQTNLTSNQKESDNDYPQ